MPKQGHQQIYTNKSEKGREQRSRNFKHVASPSARNQTKLNAECLRLNGNAGAKPERKKSQKNRSRKLNIQRNQQDKHGDRDITRTQSGKNQQKTRAQQKETNN